MRSKHVRMVIRQDGACTVDAMNFTDATCTQATQQILQTLTGTTVAEHLKPEGQRLPPQAHQRMEATR